MTGDINRKFTVYHKYFAKCVAHDDEWRGEESACIRRKVGARQSLKRRVFEFLLVINRRQSYAEI